MFQKYLSILLFLSQKIKETVEGYKCDGCKKNVTIQKITSLNPPVIYLRTIINHFSKEENGLKMKIYY